MKPTVLAKAPDGTVRTIVAIGLAEYVVPAIDAAQHIEQLCGEAAVEASSVPVIGAIFSGALEFGAKFADGEVERWVLHTGPVSRAYLDSLKDHPEKDPNVSASPPRRDP